MKRMGLIEVEENLNMCERYIKKINGNNITGAEKTKVVKKMNKLFPRLKKEMLDLMAVGLFDITKAEIKRIETSIRNITLDEKEKNKKKVKKVNETPYATRNIKQAVAVTNRVTNLDNRLVDIIKILERNKNSLCLGTAHTFYGEIKNTLANRRRAKNDTIQETGRTRVYTCRTEKFEKFLKKNKITQLGTVKIDRDNAKKFGDGGVSYMELYERDIKHFIELSPNQNLRVSYLIVNELMKVNGKKIKDKELTGLESRLFKK